MATGAMSQVVKYLRRVALPRGGCGPTDGQLLAAFLASRDEAAFEMLVRRHAGMVLGVCRRVLGNVHDAEDAFQATFLVLARKAGSVVPREQVGNWLHGVALRTALEARGRRARRRARERQVTDMPHPSADPDVDFQELHRLLDQELNRLPAKYRSGIILCDLEGRSRKQAARQLGLPEGTLSSRLATGRQMLARRLARHGITVPAAALAAALANQATAASVGPALLGTAAKIALAAACQSAAGLVSAQVLTLSQGVIKTMLLHRLKVVTVLLLGTFLGGLGAGVIAVPSRSGAVAHAQAPAAPTGTGVRGDPEEPLDASLLLDPQIQKELRLSSGQIQRLKEAASEADRNNAGTHKEIEQLRKQIAEIEKQVERLHGKLEADRSGAVRRAAPTILSARAIERLRQIQHQSRSPEQVLKDPRFQRWLNLDDEQMMRIEKVLKESPVVVSLQTDIHRLEAVPYHSTLLRYAIVDNAGLHNAALPKVAEILTPEQRRALRAWLGEPFRDGNWSWLRPNDKAKGP
jgi:RNA polymerase sigma factor (sigma-70 family)